MILGITPARGGSKGVPRKNIRDAAGKPLICWTIEAALRSKLIDRYVVSTEDEGIAKVASACGAEIIKRPKYLSGDKVSTLEVLRHAVKNIPSEAVVLLQATSPLRSEGLIDSCIKEFLDKRYDSLATGFYCKYKEYGKSFSRRQDIKGFFYDDGNVYVIRSSLIRAGDRYGSKLGRRVISRWENIEIDDEFDLWMADKALREFHTKGRRSKP